MARVASISHGKKFALFLNLSFLFLLFVFLVYINPSMETVSPSLLFLHVSKNNITCSNVNQYHDYEAKCEYVRSNKDCQSDGYINYLHIFYCTFGQSPISGYILLLLWLLILFYILGNTAANYFCSSLEGLSRVLKLSPSIAGVTLLSLGNGANDVFASLASFMGDGTGGVGLNSILGGAFFISCVIIAVISFSTGGDQEQVSLEKPSFLRDILFLLLSLCSLLLILIIGKINIYGAVCFFSLYAVYVAVVSTTHLCSYKNGEASPILPITKDSLECAPEEDESGTPLLGFPAYQKPDSTNKCGSEDDDQKGKTGCFRWLVICLLILELPLYLPRRLTIPVVSEEKWSKPFAVVSVTLAPVLLALLWNSRRGTMGSETGLAISLTAALLGLIFGSVSIVATNSSKPPRTCLLPWLVGGFLMSITWSYIIAEELVSLLVSLGIIFGINPSILGLTLLAWGNSLGDLIANVALAKKNGADGVQVAISGCYAGPFFNTVVGLGLSLIFSCWSAYPSSYIIPKDPSLYETLGFLMSGLLWTLIILPKKDMKLDKVLGAGLLAIYLCFLSVRMVQTLGIVELHKSS